MKNDEYFHEIHSYMDSIETCIEKTKEMAVGVIGENLISMDLCFCGLMDRSIRIAQGFTCMLKERNLTCAGALLRMQIDNCLRLYALNIAEDEDAVVKCVLEGQKIGSLKDKEGNRMTDKYLKEKLEHYDKLLPTVYDNASGFIHFSEKAIFQSIYECQDFTIRFQVGGELHERLNETLIECASAYIHYYRLFLSFLEGEVIWKKDFDKSHELA